LSFYFNFKIIEEEKRKGGDVVNKSSQPYKIYRGIP